jgi:2-oxoglutarate dehydrogenase E2 component (dihydrolipoamide succinyltransferase)
MIDVVMPQLGESVAEGTVTKWLVREGDFVTREQPLLEVATDKADTEVPAPADGRVVMLAAPEGALIAKGGLLCRIDETAIRNEAPASKAAEPRAPAPATQTMPSPSPSTGSRGEPEITFQTGPSQVTSAETPLTSTMESEISPELRAEKQGLRAPLASPSARIAARQVGVDLSAVQSNDKYGRITREDVIRTASQAPLSEVGPAMSSTEARSAPPTTVPQPPAAPQQPAAPQGGSQAAELTQLLQQGGGFVPPIPGVGFGSYKVPPYTPKPGDQVVPFSRRRRITADHMVYSKVTSPHVVTVAEVDLHATSRLRDAHKDRMKKEGVPLTFLAFICTATIKALREHPTMNARVLDQSYAVLRDINLGVAVDTEGGLIVPSIKQADGLSLRGIAKGIDDLATRARSGKITADDLAGTTFTVSNPGLKGNLFGGAIISQPNVGILRMGEIKKRVVVVTKDGEDAMAIHPVMFLALSYDHRIIDGVLANSFLWRVADILTRGEFEV